MALNEKHIDLLEGYMAGNLSTEKENEVTERLQTDEEFRDTYDSLKNLKDGIRYHKSRELLKQLQEEETRITGTAPERQAELVRMQPWKRALAVAAVILGLVFGGYFIWWATTTGSVDTETLYTENFTPAGQYDVLPARGQSKVYQEAFQAYNSADYELAAVKFEEYLKNNEDPLATLYLAVSHMVIANIDQAVVLLQDLQDEDFERKYEADWYLALAYIKTGEIDAAWAILTRLEEGDSPFAQKASTLKQQL